jgi:hypothetical protein
LEYAVIDLSLEGLMKFPQHLNYLDLKAIHVALVCYYRHFVSLKINATTVKPKLEPYIKVSIELFLAWKNNLDRGDLETFIFGLGVISEYGKEFSRPAIHEEHEFKLFLQEFENASSKSTEGTNRDLIESQEKNIGSLDKNFKHETLLTSINAFDSDITGASTVENAKLFVREIKYLVKKELGLVKS